MNIDNLLSCPMCENLPVNERDHFVDDLNIKTKYFKKGEWIAHQGDIIKSLYILLKGSAKAEMISDSGTVLNIETIQAPKPLASAFIFAENNRFPVDVIALEDCEVITIAKETLMKQLANNEAFLQEFMAFNADRTHFLSERLKVFSTKTIKGKLAQYILALSHNMDFTMDKNQTELSEYFGVARPSLSRSLSEMINEKIITLKGKQGKILNLAKLKKIGMQ